MDRVIFVAFFTIRYCWIIFSNANQANHAFIFLKIVLQFWLRVFATETSLLENSCRGATTIHDNREKNYVHVSCIFPLPFLTRQRRTSFKRAIIIRAPCLILSIKICLMTCIFHFYIFPSHWDPVFFHHCVLCSFSHQTSQSMDPIKHLIAHNIHSMPAKLQCNILHNGFCALIKLSSTGKSVFVNKGCQQQKKTNEKESTNKM